MLNHAIQILHSDTTHKTFLIILGLNREVVCTNMHTKIYTELNTYKEQTDWISVSLQSTADVSSNSRHNYF